MADPKLAQTSVMENRTAPNVRWSPAEVATILAEATAFGVDLEALRYNLKLTPAQRLSMLQAGLRSWRTLRNARPL